MNKLRQKIAKLCNFLFRAKPGKKITFSENENDEKVQKRNKNNQLLTIFKYRERFKTVSIK